MSSVTNRGDYPSPVNVIVTGEDDETGQIKTQLVGFGTVLTITIPGGLGAVERIVRVDSEQKVCTLEVGGVTTVRNDLISFDAGYTWPQAQPGANVFTWSLISGGSPDPASKIFFREAFA